MGTTYTVGAKIIIKYDQSEIKTTIDKLNNFVKANPLVIDKIKIDSGALNNIKANLDKLSIKLDNVSINNVKLPSNAVKEIKSKIESISFKLGNLKLDTSKIDGKKINLTLFVPPSEITKLKQQIEGLRPIIRVQVQGQNTFATPGSGSLAQAKTFADSLTSVGQYKGNTLISYDYDQAGKLIAVLKNAQNETIRLKYQFDEASRSFQQIGSSTKVPDLLNQSTAVAQRTFADLRKITEQFNILKQQSGSNPIDFKTSKLIPDLELLNTKLRTLSTGMQQVTQTYKLNETQTISASGNYNMLRGQMDSLSTSTGNLINRQIGLSESFSVAISRFPIWIVASTLVMGAIHKISEAFNFMAEQNKLFMNLQMEMTNTNLVFGDITNTANKFASAMGSTTQNVMKSISVFGTYTATLDEVIKKSESAIILSNITGQSIETSADQLMGILSQFRLAADDTAHVTDVLAGTARMLQVDYPEAVKQVSLGLSTMGSVASEAKLSIEETSGVLGTLVEKTRRSGSEVGNALKTIISRISRVGEESDPEAFKGIEKAFYDIGVSIKSSSDTIKPMGDILKSTSERWSQLSDVQKSNLAQEAAGVYRRNYFITLMNGYQDVLKNTEAATNSESVAMSKQEIYSNSLAASVSRLTSAWEKFYLNAINTDTWKSLIQGITFAVNGFANFADVVGGIPAVLTTVVLSVSLLSEKFRNFMSGLLGFNTIGAFITSIKAAQVAMNQLNSTRVSFISVAFREISASVWVYITAIKEAYLQQMQLGRTNNLNPLIARFNALSAAATSAGVASKLAGLALSVGLGIATLGISVVLSLVIGKLITFADNMIHAKEKAKEAFDTIQKSISSLSSEVAQSQTLISTYEELSAKKNKTTEETQSLAQATEKLSSLLPQSIEGFDSEGKAILGSADSLREYLDLKKQELELNKQKLVSDFYKNESTQIDDIIEKQNRLNDLKDKLAEKTQTRAEIIDPTLNNNGNTYTPSEKVSHISGVDIDINKIKDDIATVQGEILKANSAMSSGLKAVTQTELESLNLSSTSLSNFSKSYMGMISEISEIGEKPSQILSTLFNTFKTDANIKPIIDEWNTSLEGLQKGSIDASKAEEIHSKSVKDLFDAILKDNPNMDKNIISAFVNGLIVLGNVAPPAKQQITDVAKAIESVSESTESYLSDSKDLASTIAKMNDGHKLTTEELYKLLKAHPELASAMTKVNGLYTIEKSAIEKVMEAKNKAHKESLDQKKKELDESRKLLLAKLGFNKAEIESGIFLARAKNNLIIGTDSRDAGANASKNDSNQPAIDALQQIENAIKEIDVSSQITPKDLIASANPDLNKTSKEILENVAGPYADIIRESAKQNKLSATLIDSVIKAESGFNASARNPSGASGLMQLMPGTARDLGVSNVFDPAQNVEGGSKYLAQMMSAFNNDKELALAAYNWGIGNVKNALRKSGGATFADISGYAPSETRNYVSKIMSDFNSRKSNETAVAEIGDRKLTDPSFTDNTDALIAEANAQHLLTSEKSKTIQKEIEQAKSNKDVNLLILKTNELIENQQIELQQLNEARTKINTMKDSALASSPFGDTSRWFNDQNEMSSQYVSEFNSQNAEVQKTMESTFATMQKLRKSWVDNKKAVEDLTQSLQSLQSSQADEAITALKQYYENQKKIDDEAYTKKANKEEKRHQQVLDNLDSELEKQEESINAQIKAIDKLADAEDYNKNLTKSQSEVQVLQNEKNSLSLDTSSEGKARVAELQKQIDEKNSSIADTQSTHTRDLRKQNLQDNLDAIKKEVDAQKSAENEMYNAKKESLEKEKQASDDHYNALMANEQYFANLRKAIIDGNITSINEALTKFSDDFTIDLTSKAKEIDESFKAIIDTINQIKSASNSIPSIDGYASGTKSHPGGLAKVSELGPELITTPDGHSFLSGNNGPEIVNLPKDSEVLPADLTKQLLKKSSIPAYANGIGNINSNGILSDILSKIDIPNLLKSIQLPTFSVPQFQMPQLANNTNTSNSVTIPQINFNVTSTDGVISRKELDRAADYTIKKIEKAQTIRGR